MSFFRDITECIYKKTETEISISVNAIGLSYSLLSCSPAELNSASLNNVNIMTSNIKSNSTVYFTLPEIIHLGLKKILS